MTNAIIVDYEHTSYGRLLQRRVRELPKDTRNYIWLVQDVIAGITVGIVIVPQSMGYAKIAQLPPQYGLYTSFVGLCVYCLFATSKDISIGPTAVMSLLIGQTITRVTSSSTITGPEIAVAMSLFTGIIALLLGLVRLGILVDFIPGPAIAGFMSGSAITITIGQWPKLFGLKEVNTQDSTYLIFGNFFKHLPDTRLDVAFGLAGLVWLYGVRYACQYYGNRYPKYNRSLFFFSIMRNGILVVFGTLIAFLINIGKSSSPISILKDVPSGFQAMGVPRLNGELVSAVASSLPSGVIILILEHVAIAKSFGRINDYSINPDQEVIAIGFTNVCASFFGAYPSTGSFSRTAIKARSGVKTPIAGIFSSMVVILALYALTPAFYYIPDAILAAVVIHAVADLVSGPEYMKRLASVSLWEMCVFLITVIITFFTTVEYGIYASTCLSLVILLFRIARPRFWGLGRVALASETEKHLYVSENHPSLGELVEPLPDGILMCRIDESLTYPNSSYIADKIIAYCKNRSRRAVQYAGKGDRAWNDDADPEKDAKKAQLPLLHALIFDFASVNRLDSSGLQAIVDSQNTLNRYAGHHVEFHFVNLVSPAVRRSLIVAGFGNQLRAGQNRSEEILPVVPASKDGPQALSHQKQIDIESAGRDTACSSSSSSSSGSKNNDFIGINHSSKGSSYPIPLPKDRYAFFHWSCDEAVKSALQSLAVADMDDEERKIGPITEEVENAHP
ncbi:hypothetical protein EC973_006205 [Apophysomyces ossiformis]|uniref:STAS domain-containing protein n=1 Tax=Apophysomyces ossiformis TaxID=679940 RepID=A0A8H7BVS4_9FUNG|nr:hypothetical protein EC973_006205 [Apophysomyces ossiformis]